MRGANPNLTSGHRGFSACDWAVMRKLVRTTAEQAHVAKFLLLHSAREDVGQLDAGLENAEGGCRKMQDSCKVLVKQEQNSGPAGAATS